MKSIFSIVIGLLWCLNTKAQIELHGTVSDGKTGEKLQGVVIYFPDLKQGAATDSLGHFKFLNLPKGKFVAAAKYVGYATATFTVALNRDTIINVPLGVAAAELTDVVVTGVSKSTEIRQSPVAITLVGGKDLQTTTSTNIVDAIAKLPGVAGIATGPAISKPVIRGLGYNRVVTLNDGFRQEGQQWGDEHGVEIDEASIGRVEILRGPGSLMYGSDAIAGVVNFLPPEPLTDGKVALNALVNYQSNNHLISTSLMTAGNINGVSWLIRGSNKTAGNYSNPVDGVVWNSGYREWDMNGSVGVSKKWGYTNVSFSTFNQQIGFNEGLRDSLGNFVHDVALNDTTAASASVTSSDLKGYGIAVPYQRVSHHRVSMQNKIFIGRGSLVIDAGWQMNERREFGNILAPNTSGLHFLMHTATLDVQYHLPDMKDWSTVFGISGMYQKSLNKGNEFLIPEYNMFDYGLYGITQKRFGKLLFEGGLRFDQRFFHSLPLYLDGNDEPVAADDPNGEPHFIDLKKTFYNFSGSAGISYSPNENWSVKFNVAKGFRAPVASELASNGQHDGTFRYEYGNNTLKPESSYQVDAGISYTSEHVNFNLDAFENTILNFIYAQKLSSVAGGDSLLPGDAGDLIPVYEFKQGDAVLAGAEVTMDIHPHPADWLHFENSFDYVYAVNLHQADSSKYLPYTPPAHYRSELRFDIPKTGRWVRGLFAGVHFDYYFQQNHVLLQNNTETPTPDYALLGASAGFDFYANGKMHIFTLIVSAENITNTAYQSHLSRLKYLDVNPANGKQGIWNMGRNISVKLVVPLQWDVKTKG